MTAEHVVYYVTLLAYLALLISVSISVHKIHKALGRIADKMTPPAVPRE